jgi:AcrR family transcriptional regulator
MRGVTVRDDETRSGRPRDPSRDEAILGATRDLLGEVGYEQVTVRAIAQRAGAGLATLYRRWPTKEELVVDAVASMPELPELPDQPGPGSDPVEVLVELVSGLVDLLQGRRRELIPTVVGQLPRNPALAEALRDRVVLPRLAAVSERLAAVPGVDPGRVGAAAELVPASVFFQVLILGRHLTDGDVRRVVDAAVSAAR